MFCYVHVEASAIFPYVFVCPLAGINQWASTLLMEMSMTKVRKLVSKKELRTVHGIPYSFPHIARLEKAGQFPKRLLLGACRVAWWEDEIEEWKASRPRAA
jgi:prophage regulatory protein